MTLDELDRLRLEAPGGVYSPVFSLATGWILGRIENHVAKPFEGRERQSAVAFSAHLANACDPSGFDLLGRVRQLDRLKAALEELLYCIQHYRTGGIRVEACHEAEQKARQALAAQEQAQ